MSVTVDDIVDLGNTIGVSTVSWNHTSAGSDRQGHVLVGYASAGSMTPDFDVTWGGVSMTPIISAHAPTLTYNFAKAVGLINQAIGTQSIVVTLSPSGDALYGSLGSLSVNDADQTTGWAHADSVTGAGTSATIGITSMIGNLVVDVLAVDGLGATTSAGTFPGTQTWIFQGSASGFTGTGTYAAGAPLVNMERNDFNGSAAEYAMLGYEILAVGGGGGGPGPSGGASTPGPSGSGGAIDTALLSIGGSRMPGFLRQSTAGQGGSLGLFLDSDGNPVTTLTITNTDIKLIKNGAGTAVNKNSGGAAHRANGDYALTWNASDTDTVGRLDVSCSKAGAAAVADRYIVLTAAAHDALFGSSAPGPALATDLADIATKTNVGIVLEGTIAASPVPTTTSLKLTGTTVFTADEFKDMEIVVVSSGRPAPARGVINTSSNAAGAVITLYANHALPWAPVAGDTIQITATVGDGGLGNKLDTALEAGVGGAYRFTTPALVNAPTGGSAPSAAAIRAEMDSNSTKLIAIDNKTTNLPSDPADASDVAAAFATVNGTLSTLGSYVDTEVAAIKAKTDQLTFTQPNKVDSSVQGIGNNTSVNNFERALRSTVIGTVGSGSHSISLIAASTLTPATTTADQVKGRMLVFADNTTTAALRGAGSPIDTSNSSGRIEFTYDLPAVPVNGDTFSIQ